MALIPKAMVFLLPFYQNKCCSKQAPCCTWLPVHLLTVFQQLHSEVPEPSWTLRPMMELHRFPSHRWKMEKSMQQPQQKMLMVYCSIPASHQLIQCCHKKNSHPRLSRCHHLKFPLTLLFAKYERGLYCPVQMLSEEQLRICWPLQLASWGRQRLP